MKRTPISILMTLLTVLAVAGCEYAGPAGDPVSRNVGWFDYVGGESLKDACGPGASTRLRFVYNGIYDQQIRSYDVRELPNGRGAAMSAWARGKGDLTRGVRFPNLLSPWQGERAESVMSVQAMADLRAALVRDRFASFKPVGMRLPSNEFYWAVTGCIDGRFHANAWMYPSERFRTLAFPAVLQASDRTGIEFRAARPVNQREDDPTRHEGDRNPADGTFEIQLGANGFVGARGLF
tara:strand:- start:1458 stop:2168 length:711 start_codon:yes stop_codon:yes gene_type:complete